MTDFSQFSRLRSPLRPLSQILPARARGEDTRQIERDNIRKRHLAIRDKSRLMAQGRMLVLGGIFLCLYAVLIVRIGILSSAEPTEPTAQELGLSIVAQRADIVDRKGRILATNMETHSLYVETIHLVDAAGTAEALTRIFSDLDSEKLSKSFTDGRKFLWIKKKISPEQMQRVHDIGDPGLRFGPREMRLYPNGNLAAHILGGTSFGREGVHSAEVVGIAGVEKSYDTRLRDPRQSATPLKLSIDLSVQAATEQVLSAGMQLMNAKGAAAVLMEVETGKVISLASLPDFNPNDRPAPPGQGQAADSPLFNRAVQGVYELGSTFKIFTAAQAMELGLVNPQTIIDIRGPIRWGRFSIRDHRYLDKELSVADIIIRSSNIGTARIAQLIGAERQQNFLEQLGLLTSIPFEMIEASGGKPILPPHWSELSTMTISYGHGLSATPLHLASAYATIANGGLKVQPTLFDSPRSVEKKRLISPEVASASLAMLREVVHGKQGTASFARLPGYAVAGKTGTADKPNPHGGYYKDKVLATFASVFPADNPKYVLVVTLDEPEERSNKEPRRTAGWTAVPVASELIARIAPLLGVRPQFETQQQAAISYASSN